MGVGRTQVWFRWIVWRVWTMRVCRPPRWEAPVKARLKMRQLVQGKLPLVWSSPPFGCPPPWLLPPCVPCVHLLTQSSLASESMAQFQDCTVPREAHHRTRGVFPKSSVTGRRGGLEWLWLGAHAFTSQAITGRSSLPVVLDRAQPQRLVPSTPVCFCSS